MDSPPRIARNIRPVLYVFVFWRAVREIGFSDWGGQKNFSEARLFSPKNPRNFSQAKVFSPKIPRIFSKARFFPLKFSNFWGIWAPKQLSKAGVEQARVIYYFSYTSEARRGKNIGGAMAPPLPPSLGSAVIQAWKRRNSLLYLKQKK